MPALGPGARGPEVTALQGHLGKLGHPVVVDGRFGPETLGAVHAFARTRTERQAPAWVVAAIAEEAQDVGARTSRLRSIGAWCGSSSLAAPERDVSFAVDIGLDRLDVVVNDHSAARRARRFTTSDHGKVERLCAAAHRRGLEVHLTSWIMPHASYIDRAADVLVPLSATVGAASLLWDAEEPWTNAIDAPSRSTAASRLADRFADLARPMGVTGIGYTPVAKFGPLAAVCSYVVPQAYATASNGLAPEVAPVRFHKRYVDNFHRPVLIGLAAYRQAGIAGHTPASAVRSALLACASLQGVDTVLFWSLGWLRRSPDVAATITALRRR